MRLVSQNIKGVGASEGRPNSLEARPGAPSADAAPDGWSQPLLGWVSDEALSSFLHTPPGYLYWFFVSEEYVVGPPDMSLVRRVVAQNAADRGLTEADFRRLVEEPPPELPTWHLTDQGNGLYPAMIERLNALAQRYPDVLQLQTLEGSTHSTLDERTDNDRPIVMVEVSGGSSSEATSAKPTLYIQAGIHGREVATPEWAVRLVEWLAAGYEESPQLRELLDRVRILVVPSVNPDGLQQHSRTNAAGVDLNRNFDPDHWGRRNGTSEPTPGKSSARYRGPSPLSEPESQAIDEILRSSAPALMFDIHQAGNVLSAPTAYETDFTLTGEPAAATSADTRARLSEAQTWGEQLAEAGSWRVTQFKDSGDVINHAFYEYGTPAFALELSTGFIPSYEERDEVLERNLIPVLNALLQTGLEAGALDLRTEAITNRSEPPPRAPPTRIGARR